MKAITRGKRRYYVDPMSPGVLRPSIDSVLEEIPKEFLRYWAARHSPLASSPSEVVRVALSEQHPEPSPRNHDAAHDLFERMSRGEAIGRVHPDLEPFVAHFDEFQKLVKPEYHYLEETVWSDTHQYAGSFDAFATIDGQRVWVDNKTTRSGIHEEVGLQLAAYRYADAIIREDGSRVPMPESDGGVVLHVRPEGWKLVPVRADEQMFETFLRLREIFRHERGA